MITRFGMDEEIWAENFEAEANNYTWAMEKPLVSDDTIKKIDIKVKEMLQWAYNKALKIIKDNKNLHKKIAEKLLEVEELTEEEFNAYFA
jgi:cell division protease FtsH